MRKLIDLLSDGQFHPGEELGDVLGISRAGVWKQVQKLQDAGLDVQSVRGKGYRLAFPMEWLDASVIRSHFPHDFVAEVKHLEVLEVTGSTNDVAMAKASQGVGSGYVCLAEQQTAGRGRRGRSWVSPMATNLYLSLVWEFHQGAAQLEGLSLAAGVAVVDALSELGVVGVGLKWPNDLLAGDAKLGGILLEMTGDPAGRCQVVLGIGLNHRIPASVKNEIDQKIIRLEDLKPGVGRNQLAASMIVHLVRMLRTFSIRGFSAFRPRWLELDLYRGLSAEVRTGAENILGVASGVDESGGLLLQTETGIRVMKGGELSLRLLK